MPSAMAAIMRRNGPSIPLGPSLRRHAVYRMRPPRRATGWNLYLGFETGFQPFQGNR